MAVLHVLIVPVVCEHQAASACVDGSRSAVGNDPTECLPLDSGAASAMPISRRCTRALLQWSTGVVSGHVTAQPNGARSPIPWAPDGLPVSRGRPSVEIKLKRNKSYKHLQFRNTSNTSPLRLSGRLTQKKTTFRTVFRKAQSSSDQEVERIKVDPEQDIRKKYKGYDLEMEKLGYDDANAHGGRFKEKIPKETWDEDENVDEVLAMDKNEMMKQSDEAIGNGPKAAGDRDDSTKDATDEKKVREVNKDDEDAPPTQFSSLPVVHPTDRKPQKHNQRKDEYGEKGFKHVQAADESADINESKKTEVAIQLDRHSETENKEAVDRSGNEDETQEQSEDAGSFMSFVRGAKPKKKKGTSKTSLAARKKKSATSKATKKKKSSGTAANDKDESEKKKKSSKGKKDADKANEEANDEEASDGEVAEASDHEDGENASFIQDVGSSAAKVDMPKSIQVPPAVPPPSPASHISVAREVKPKKKHKKIKTSLGTESIPVAPGVSISINLAMEKPKKKGSKSDPRKKSKKKSSDDEANDEENDDVSDGEDADEEDEEDWDPWSLQEVGSSVAKSFTPAVPPRSPASLISLATEAKPKKKHLKSKDESSKKEKSSKGKKDADDANDEEASDGEDANDGASDTEDGKEALNSLFIQEVNSSAATVAMPNTTIQFTHAVPPSSLDSLIILARGAKGNMKLGKSKISLAIANKPKKKDSKVKKKKGKKKMSLNGAGKKPKEKEDPKIVKVGESASLDEKGYKTVAKTKSNKAMEKYIARCATRFGLTVVDPGGLSGIVPYYSGKIATQNFKALKKELLVGHHKWLKDAF